MTEKRKRVKLWICRITEGVSDTVMVAWATEPPTTRGLTHVLYGFCARTFLRLTGIRLHPGECREIEIVRGRDGFEVRMKPKEGKP